MFLLFRVMVSSYYWVKSLNKSSEGKHEEALLLLEKASINRTFYDEIYYSHKGFLLAAIGNKNESLINFNKAFEYSNSKKSKLNKDEKIYMLNYAAYVLSFLDVYEEPFKLSNSYDIENVAQHIVHKFPYE